MAVVRVQTLPPPIGPDFPASNPQEISKEQLMALSWPPQQAAINFAGPAGDNTLIAGIAGQIVTVYQIFFVVSAAATLTFKDGTTALTGAMNFAANESFTLAFATTPHFFASAGNNFVLTQTTTTAQVSGRIYFVQR
jgi:hypothetical protein